jgi:zinc protease
MRAIGRPILSFVALLVLLAGGDGRANPAIDDPVLRTRQTTLANGLTVVTLEDHATPVVSFQMWVRVGSRDETRVTGLAHLFEHMMFKGSKHVAPEQHARIIQARGGRTNAYTTSDVTVYITDLTSETLPLVIALEAERVANLDISEQTLTSEREVVLEERRMRTEDRPAGRAFEALYALTFQAHPYRTPVIGWRSDIESTTVENCREFFSTYYVPNNVVIVIVGDFDSEQALDRVREAFGSLAPAPEIPRNPTREPRQRGARWAQVHFDLRGPLFVAAWHAPPAGHPDGEALDVASEILSGGRSSRVYRRLIYDEQVALSAHGGYSAIIERVEELFLEEITRLRDGPVTAGELDKAKRQIEVSMVDELTTNKALASRIGYEVTILGQIRPLEDRLAAIRAVTAADVQRVARTYLSDEGTSIVQVVPPPVARETDPVAPEPERGGS